MPRALSDHVRMPNWPTFTALHLSAKVYYASVTNISSFRGWTASETEAAAPWFRMRR